MCLTIKRAFVHAKLFSMFARASPSSLLTLNCIVHSYCGISWATFDASASIVVAFEFSSILCSRASIWALEWMQMRALGLDECATYRRLLHPILYPNDAMSMLLCSFLLAKFRILLASVFVRRYECCLDGMLSISIYHNLSDRLSETKRLLRNE